MKNSKKLLAILFIAVLVSCNRDENVEQVIKSKDLSPVSLLLRMSNPFEETDAADATFNILGQSVYINEPQMSENGLLSFTAGSNLLNVNIGDVLFNDVLVRGSDNYNKFYDETQLVEQSAAINNIFGKDVTVRNINCTGSTLCNFNFKIPILHKFNNANIVGLVDTYFIEKSNGFTLTWDSTNIATDEVIGVVIIAADPNSKVGDSVPSFAKLATNNNQVIVSAADLSKFDLNKEIDIMLVKGKSYTNTLSNGKKVRVIAGDIINFIKTLR